LKGPIGPLLVLRSDAISKRGSFAQPPRAGPQDEVHAGPRNDAAASADSGKKGRSRVDRHVYHGNIH
jgi:hypothetical protein